MWICLSDAFVSIVAHREEPDALMVRARRAGDLERVFPGCDVVRTPRADYLYRTTLPRDQVAAAIARELLRVDYANFKDSVPDAMLHGAYSSFWAAMLRVQQSGRALEPYQVRRTRTPKRAAAMR
jgi:hypothetical protein